MVLKIPLVSVSLATVALESCLFGVHLVLAITSISLLLSRDGRSRRTGSVYSSPIFIGAIGLSLSITGHWILTVDRAFLAFVYFADGTSPLGFYGDLSQLTEVVKTGFLMATLIIGDALIIHRLWIVWGRNKYIMIFPMCTLLGLTVCGVGITYQFTQYKPGLNVFSSEAGRWITSDAVFTLATNLYGTVFISWRLWNTGRAIQPYSSPQSLKTVLAIIIESAGLYTFWSLFFFVTYRSGSNLQFIAADCWPAMSGISCLLIHVRVGLGWTSKGNSSSLVGAQPKPFAVNITRAVHTNMDPEYPMGELDDGGGKSSV